MLLWFKPTLIVGNDFSLDEQCLHRVENRYFVYNFNWFRVEYFSVTISALTEPDWVVFLGNHPIITLIVGNDFSLDEQCLYRVGNRHLVYSLKWFRVEYFSVTISALTEPDWVVFLGNHAIMV